MSHIGTIIDFEKACLPTFKTKDCGTNGGTTNVTVTPEKFTEATPIDYQGIRITNTVTLPAGALSVEILPKEYLQPVTINGVLHYEGDRFHRQMTKDPSTCKLYYVNEIVIESNPDAPYNLAISYPEGHAVDFVALGL